MIYLIIYLVGVLFSIALCIFVLWKDKRPIYLGDLITIPLLSAFSWISFMIIAAIGGSDILIFDFGSNDRKNKMRE